MSTVVMTEVMHAASAADVKGQTQPTSGSSDARKLTILDVLWNYFQSPATMFGILSLGMGLWSSGNIDNMAFMVVNLVGGTAIAAVFVTKLENSEWRRELRRQCEEKERAMGISHKDKVEMSFNMGLSMPAPPTVPDNKPAENKAPAEKKTD